MENRLRIAQVAPLWSSVPPKKYGGTELIVSLVSDELVIRGYDVSLFASGDSKTKAKLISVVKRSLEGGVAKGDFGPDFVIKNELLSNLTAFMVSQQFDLIHAHSHYLGAAFANFTNIPTVITLHCYPKGPELIIMQKSKAKFVSISDNFRRVAELDYIDTVYNGLDISKYSFNEKGGENLVAIGRLSPKKGIGEAIQTALKTTKKLKIATPLPQKAIAKKHWLIDDVYYNKEIKPFLDKRGIRHIGEIGGHSEKNDFYSSARALLFPIQWEEPFGLVMIEAMSCGTPVVAYAQGSVPEIIKDGITGFIVNISDKDKRGDWIIKKIGMRGLIEAVEKIYAMPKGQYQAMRRACRAHVEKNFTVEKMVSGYEEVYNKVLSDWKKKRK